jgi:hypothetical protein
MLAGLSASSTFLKRTKNRRLKVLTDIIYHQARISKIKKDADTGFGILEFVPVKVKELHIHKAGEDGQLLWFEFVLENGEKEQTGYYKEA